MNPAIFDIDGTLLAGSRSSEALFVRHLLRRGAVGWRQVVSAAWFTLCNWPRYRRHVFRKNKAYLAGLAVEDVVEVAREFIDRELAAGFDRTIVQRIEDHRRAGHAILLLSGTPDFLAGPLAERVGADGWRGARCAVSDGRFVADPPVVHPLGDEKVSAAADLCAEIGARLEDAAAYADSIHDLALLASVARPVAVRPDRRLAAEARARGWEIIGSAVRGDRAAAAGQTRLA